MPEVAAVDRVAKAAEVLEQVAQRLEQEVQEAIKAGALVPLLILFRKLTEAYERLDASRKLVYNIQDSMNKGSVPEALENSGQDLARVPELKRSFYIVPKMSVSVLDKDKAFQWLRGNNGDGLIQPTVNAQTLAAFIGQHITDTGIDPPEDVFKVSPYKTTGSSKYTPKEPKGLKS